MIKKTKEYGKTYKTPHNNLCNSALEHYEQISNYACEWNSVVPKAIKFYKNYAKKIESAYWAGVIDSDGWIIIAKRNNKRYNYPTYTLIFGYAQKNKLMVEQAKTFFNIGGSITFNKKRNIYNWNVPSNMAISCIKKILPFLKLKKERALLAIKFRKQFINYQGGNRIVPKSEFEKRESFYQQMKTLIKEGK